MLNAHGMRLSSALRATIHRWHRTIVSVSLALLVSACGGIGAQFDQQDRTADLGRSDYRDALAPRETARPGSVTAPPIPEAEPLVALPDLTLPANARLVTISVNQEVPLRDLLVELARQAEVGLELDPNIEGAVIFSVRQRPFEEVIDRISDMAGLRYMLVGNVLRVERDQPFLRSYRVDYLNIARETTSSISTNVDVVGGESVGGEGAGGDGNASASEVRNQSQSNFWDELESNLAVILGRSHRVNNLLTQVAAPAGILTVPSAQTTAEDVQPVQADGQADNLTGAAQEIADTIGGVADTPTASQATPTQSGNAPAQTEEEPFSNDDARQLFTINRVGGLITIYATQRQHELVADYLEQLRASVAGLVLIEAKVLEVQLTDNFESGVNWSAVLGKFSGAARFGNTVAVPQTAPFNDLVTATQGVVTLGVDSGDIDGVINLVQTFGTVRTLSSPRLTVLHNQTAVLKVVENRVFFELDVEREEQEDGDERVTVESTIRTVPEGVIITVQPSIGVADDITMTLRPTITRITGTVNDPGVAIASNNTVQSAIPIIAVQEIDSVVTVRSGRVLVMGGLMQDRSLATETGAPGASSVPLVGNLFKSREDENRQTELVIFLRATIVEGSGAAPVDVDLYRTFGRDRRPLPL